MSDRPATEPRTEATDADECGHMTLTRWTGEPGVDDIWACSDCRRRFYPACPECVSVGHRDGHRAEAAQGAALPLDPNDQATPFQRGYDLGLHHGRSERAAPRAEGLETARENWRDAVEVLRDALEVQRTGCDHEGIGKPGCRTCDPRTYAYSRSGEEDQR